MTEQGQATESRAPEAAASPAATVDAPDAATAPARPKAPRKRDVPVEAARVLACLFVIGIHVTVGMMFDGEISRSAIYLTCLMADAVGVFWLITGAFLFRTTSYTRLLGRMGAKIAIPLVVYAFVSFCFSGWLYYDETPAQSVAHTAAECGDFLAAVFLRWNEMEIPSGNHLWYMYVYILVCLLFPVAKAFHDVLGTTRRQVAFLCAGLGMLVLNDLSLNAFGSFTHHTFGALVPAYIIILSGSIIHEHREQIVAKVHGAWFLAAYLAVNLVRCMAQTRVFQNVGTTSASLLSWYSGYGLVCAACLYLFVYSVTRHVGPDTRTAGVIRHLGGCTFGIYFIHYPVMTWLIVKRQFFTTLFARIPVGNLPARLTIYYIAAIAVLFAISYVIILLMHTVKWVFRSLSSLLRARPAADGRAAA